MIGSEADFHFVRAKTQYRVNTPPLWGGTRTSEASTKAGPGLCALGDYPLFGLGMGLYWGEGTKSSSSSVRLGNSNPRLIKRFVEFLSVTYGIDKKKLRFGLQIFGDMDKKVAVRLWRKELGISSGQIMKKIVETPHRGVGNYRVKTKYGVMTVYFNNRKLRDILCHTIDKIAMGADVAQLVEHVHGEKLPTEKVTSQ